MSPRRKPSPGGGPDPRFRITIWDSAEVLDVPASLPLLPLRDVVVFPYARLPLFVGRPGSVAALEEAASSEQKLLFAVTQLKPETSHPLERDLHAVGTVARVLQLFRLPDGTMRILIEGLARARLAGCEPGAAFPRATVVADNEGPVAADDELAALTASVRSAFERYVELNRRVPPEVALAMRAVEDPRILSCRIPVHTQLDVADKQRLLEMRTTTERLRALQRLLAAQLSELADQDRAQRMTARGRMRPRDPLFGDAGAETAAGAAQGEIGDEIEELAAAIEQARCPKAVEERAYRELDRLAKMAVISPEATVCRTYLDWLIHLPWHERTRDRTDLERVERILDEDHYGLRKVKERVLEQISVIKLSREVRGPILCLTGPPGVGKTSLGRSIARAIGRRFVRMSLGGIRDESEIRGHRRTYIGSLPGRIVQAMRRAGTINPVLMLDEVDKMGSDHRGDPAAALLEVLDPEQNVAFSDHYLEVDYDLSQVLFITTANTLHAIPEPLRDRMEVIRIPGYLESEKVQIAGRFLLPRQRKANGLVDGDVAIADPTLTQLIRDYTREAGVRNLEREVARICRRAAKVKAGGRDPVLGARRAGAGPRAPLGLEIGPAELRGLLGPVRHEDLKFERSSRVGVATGLAWTSAGGEVLNVEVGVLPGRGTLLLTGQLGETMRESAQAALSYLRSRWEPLGLQRSFYRHVDIHVHVPEGAVPKDGPSAGVTLALAMASALTGIPTRLGVALTGEITLRGHVLPVGGIGEKLVAARRVGIGTVALPKGNQEHLAELPADLLAGLTIETLETVDDVLAHGLVTQPGARRDATDLPGSRREGVDLLGSRREVGDLPGPRPAATDPAAPPLAA